MKSDQLHISWKNNGYSGELLIDVNVFSTEEHSGGWITESWFDPSIPLTNEYIDKIINFFQQYKV